MRESGGRRVERAVYIDISTVRFCTSAEIEKLVSAGMLPEDTDLSLQVNLSLLRVYLERYLSSHPSVNTDMLVMVRSLNRLRQVCHCSSIFYKYLEWKEFERIQSAIFDHVYAVVGEFGLRIFQTPAGSDLERVR